MASLILFVVLFLEILNRNRNSNLSLGFRVEKFCDSSLLDIIHGFIFQKF